MIDELLQIVAPHHCSGCYKIGSLLCDNCKYDIITEPFESCIACGQRLAGKSGICTICRVPYQRAWCVGERSDALQRLIGNYKFTYSRQAHKPLADLLDKHLPTLPENVVIVPIPTVTSHIRQRGYDHMALVTRRLAKKRGFTHSECLKRATVTKQRDATRRQRIKQASEAFECRKILDNTKTFLLIDDVVTTGSTLKYAAKVLQAAGAENIWVAALSRQPLD